MGRIDTALRRARTSEEPDPVADAGREDPFVAPWPLDHPPAAIPMPKLVADGEPEADEDGVIEMPGCSGAPSPLDRRPGAAWKGRLSGLEDCDPELNEEFRHLAATLFHSRRVDGVKTVMVTSAVPSDGKTLVALNLALTLSGSYRHRVLIIDADLRRGSISEALNVKAAGGLRAAITEKSGRKASLVALSDTLMLLPAGRIDGDPLSSLTSSRMQHLLEEAAARFDWVIVDTPPLAVAQDASLLCPMMNTALLVVRAHQTPHAAIQRAIDALGRERILGVVLNGVERRAVRGYGYYYDKQVSV